MAGKRKNDDVAGSSVMPKKRAAQEETAGAKPAAKRSEEEDFPRGGGSALTPAEIREAREEADADFEREKGKKIGKKGGKKGKHGKGEDDEFHGSILSGKLQKSADILRYKSLVVGMKIWGAVAEINNKDMVISLPGGLRGFVLAEEASEVFENVKGHNDKSKKSSQRGKKMEDQSTDLPDADKEVPLLSDLFSVGQLVACTVRKLELTQEKKGRGKPEKEGKNEKRGRRIELSLKLGYLYDGLSIEAVYEGQVKMKPTITFPFSRV